MIVVVLAVVLAVLALWVLALRLRLWIRSGPDKQDALDVEHDEHDPLVTSIRVLANRVTLNEDFYRSIKRIVSIGIVGGAVLVFLAAGLGVAFLQLHHEADARERDRVERTVGSCIQFNVQQERDRAAIADGIVTSLKPLITTASGKDGLDSLDRNLHIAVSALLPYRDCSPAGIEAFLRNPPPDPNVSS